MRCWGWVTALGALPEYQGPSRQQDSDLSRCHLSLSRGRRHLGVSASQVGLLTILTPSLLCSENPSSSTEICTPNPSPVKTTVSRESFL